MILTDSATTGDGVLAILQVLERMVTTGQSLQTLASVVQRLPKRLVNVPTSTSRASRRTASSPRPWPRRRPPR